MNPLFHKFIIDLYGFFVENNVIKCFVDYNKRKYDIVIIINNIYKRISIKMGFNNSMHCEKISSFINFLRENKITNKIIVKYLKYHYGDGTIDGSGSKRLSVLEYKKLYQEDIDEINKKINNLNFLKKVAERFVLVGTINNYSIDCIIHGTVDEFIWIKRDNIEKIIISYINNYSTGVHFGPLSVQSHNRCSNKMV